ncbi:hypothetical protein PENSUB_10581 [Penicillium subrubescens]|uniref:Uncharacterized protein n=1 Tax=Penicillium subrubescens TaxID=1316194 RepID=A0A1Q5T840_9EURO|nr:hypothetical protein PENSUB_10581 [Penicillium subrubescens]
MFVETLLSFTICDSKNLGYGRNSTDSEFPHIDILRDPLEGDQIVLEEFTRLQQSSLTRNLTQWPTRPRKRRAILSKRRIRSKLKCNYDIPWSPPYLPSEIVMKIMDFLKSPRHIEAMFKAFQNWGCLVPQQYWRRRWINSRSQEVSFLGDLLLPGPEDLDWRLVYLYFDKTIRDSQVWRYLKYIMSRLRSAEANFLKAMADKDSEEDEG